MAQRNCYDILGVSALMSTKDIYLKYRELMEQHHPSRGGKASDAIAPDKAYRVLSDRKMRLGYDIALGLREFGTPILQCSEQEGEQKLRAFEERRKKGAREKKIHNAHLHAGSPMFFYCRRCRCIADVLSEDFVVQTKKLCDECQEMEDMDLFPEYT